MASCHGLGPLHVPLEAKLRSQKLFPRAANTSMGLPPVSKLWPRCGHVRDRSARVPGPMRPTVPPQSTPCRFRFTLSQTRTISAKRAEVHQNLSRRPSPHGTATRRWPVKCRRGHHGVQTRGARAADHGIEDERHARLRALSRSVGTADGVPVTGRCRLLVNCAVSRGAGWPGQRTSRTLPGVCNFTARPRGATTMQTDAHNMGREERRALLEQRRAAVARQLRRLAIELTDLDRQLDEIEQSER